MSKMKPKVKTYKFYFSLLKIKFGVRKWSSLP